MKMHFVWLEKRWKGTANNVLMQERWSRVSTGSDEYVTMSLTRDHITRHAARKPGGKKGNCRGYQKQPEQTGSTKSEDSSHILSRWIR